MRHRRHRGEGGAVALLVAILSVVLLGAAAFVTDMGVAYSNQRDLQNGVDAAALAVGHKIAVTASPTDDCTALAAQWNGVPAQTIAQPIFAENDPSTAAGLTGATVDCESVPGLAVDQLVIHVSSTQSNATTFGRIFGVNSLTVNRQARVIAGNGLPYGLRPFAICSNPDARDLMTAHTPPPTYQPHTVAFPSTSDIHVTSTEPCGGAAGNAGLLDLDSGGGGRGAGPSGCTGVTGWIVCGLNGTVSDPPTAIDAQTGGFGGGLDAAMATLDGKEIALPVYDTISPAPGNNASYHVIRFILVKVCAWDFQIKPSDALAGATMSHRYNSCYDGGEWNTAATQALATFGNQKINFLELVYVKNVTAGELDGNCGWGDPTCSGGTPVVVLAD